MVAGILLAAGRSTRMGGVDKLLLPLGGEALVRRSARALVEAELAPLIAVVPPDALPLREALAGLPLQVVVCPNRSRGLSASLAAGVAALRAEAAAVAVALGDMPLIAPGTVRTLVRRFRQSGRSMAAPTCGGRRGHPVLFDLAVHRSRLLTLGGDTGARWILEGRAEDLQLVPVDDEGVLLDADTWEAYEQLRRRAEPS